MWVLVPLIALGAFVYFVLHPRNFHATAVAICLVFTALIAWVAYLESRPQDGAPTGTETRLATAWLLVRRIVAYGGALIFTLFALVMAVYGVYGAPEQGPWVVALEALVLLALALCFVWFARVGRGHTYDYRDDMAAHERRKRRYGWRW